MNVRVVADDSLFLSAENGVSMFMWIGHNADPDWIQQVFSVQSAAQIDIDKVGNSATIRIDKIGNSAQIHIDKVGNSAQIHIDKVGNSD